MAAASSSRGVHWRLQDTDLGPDHHDRDARLARRLQDEEYAVRAQFDIDHQMALELAEGAPQANHDLLQDDDPVVQ
jgi:hypothetical protein